MEDRSRCLNLRQEWIDNLLHVPVQVEGEWVAKLSATRPPDYLPRTEYTLRCQLAAAEPFLLTWLIGDARRLEYARGLADEAATEFEIALLQLDDWNERPPVLGFGAAGVGIDQPADLHTGVLYDWAIDALPPNLVHQVLLVARRDVETVRGHWRVKANLWPGLPFHLAFLQSGRRSGRVRMGA